MPVQSIRKSTKLDNVCYDIRGPVLDKARAMEEEGQKIIKLNIGNLAVFGLEPPDEIVQDMIRNLPQAAGYTDSKGLFAPRKSIVHYTQEKNIAGVSVDDVYLGNGASELITMSMNALLNQGDEILALYASVKRAHFWLGGNLRGAKGHPACFGLGFPTARNAKPVLGRPLLHGRGIQNVVLGDRMDRPFVDEVFLLGKILSRTASQTAIRGFNIASLLEGALLQFGIIAKAWRSKYLALMFEHNLAAQNGHALAVIQCS